MFSFGFGQFFAFFCLHQTVELTIAKFLSKQLIHFRHYFFMGDQHCCSRVDISEHLSDVSSVSQLLLDVVVNHSPNEPRGSPASERS